MINKLGLKPRERKKRESFIEFVQIQIKSNV